MPAILPARYDIPPQPGRAVPKDFPPGEDGTLRAHYGAVSIGIDHYYGNSSNPAELDAVRSSGRYTFKTLAQGAATSVYVATSSRLNGVAGRYFENCQEDTPDDPTAAGTDAAGVAAYALDPEAAERLWAVSEQMNQ